MKNSTVFHENQNYTIHIPCANATEQHKKHTGSKLASLRFLKSAPHPKFNPNKTSLIHTVNCAYHLYVGRGKRKFSPFQVRVMVHLRLWKQLLPSTPRFHIKACGLPGTFLKGFSSLSCTHPLKGLWNTHCRGKTPSAIRVTTNKGTYLRSSCISASPSRLDATCTQ